MMRDEGKTGIWKELAFFYRVDEIVLIKKMQRSYPICSIERRELSFLPSLRKKIVPNSKKCFNPCREAEPEQRP